MMSEPKVLTAKEIEKVRQRSQLASMVSADVVHRLLATIDALLEDRYHVQKITRAEGDKE